MGWGVERGGGNVPFGVISPPKPGFRFNKIEIHELIQCMLWSEMYMKTIITLYSMPSIVTASRGAPGNLRFRAILKTELAIFSYKDFPNNESMQTIKNNISNNISSKRMRFLIQGKHYLSRPGAVARSEASSLGMQAAPSSIPTSGTFFHGGLVMKTFLRPFSLFH